MERQVSVICTVKNGEHTVLNTIQSVANQTYNNFEMLIVDDGSSDATLSILNKCQEKFAFLKIIETQGVGRSEALNLAINESNGNLIANIDADDLWHPQKLEMQVKTFKEKPNYFLIGTYSKIIYDDEEPIWVKENFNDVNIEDVDETLLITNSISHPSVMMDKKRLKALGLYNINRTNLVDYELWLRAYIQNNKMGNLQSELVAKRIHKHQSFENKKRIKYTWDAAKLQIKYIFKIKKILLLPIPFIKFILGQLPFKTRQKINKRLNNIN